MRAGQFFNLPAYWFFISKLVFISCNQKKGKTVTGLFKSAFEILIFSNLLNLFIMAKLWQGLLGGVSGKVGNLVGSSWKGIPVIKSKPLSVANPRTSKQIAQRAKMSLLVNVAKALLSIIIKPLWDRFSQQESGYNAFLRENMGSISGAGTITPAEFVISKGKMAATAITDWVLNGSNTAYIITWPTALTDSYQLATDHAFAVVLSEAGQVIAVGGGSVARSAGTMSINVLPGVNPQQANTFCALAFRRADGTIVSNTTIALP